MAGIGAPKGNQFAAKDKLFRNAILNCLDQHPEGRMAAMMEIAKPLIELAKSGDIGAAKEIVDRVDGKAHQSVEMDASLTHSLVQATPTDLNL